MLATSFMAAADSSPVWAASYAARASLKPLVLEGAVTAGGAVGVEDISGPTATAVTTGPGSATGATVSATAIYSTGNGVTAGTASATGPAIASAATRTAGLSAVTTTGIRTGRPGPAGPAIATLATKTASPTGRISSGDPCQSACSTTDTAATARTTGAAVTGIATGFTTGPRRGTRRTDVAVTSGAPGATSTRDTTGTAITITPIRGVA